MTIPAPATALPWQYRDDYTTEGFVTIIGNVDGEYVDGKAECTYDVICRCEDEFGERLPGVSKNVRYLLRACNSFPALVAALQSIAKKAQSMADARQDQSGLWLGCAEEARAALSLALGEQ